MAAVRLPPSMVVTFLSDLLSEMSKPDRSASRTLCLGLLLAGGGGDLGSGVGCDCCGTVGGCDGYSVMGWLAGIDWVTLKRAPTLGLRAGGRWLPFSPAV